MIVFSTVEEISKFIKEVGFPVAVAAFLLWEIVRRNNFVKSLSVHLRGVANKLEEATSTAKNLEASNQEILKISRESNEKMVECIHTLIDRVIVLHEKTQERFEQGLQATETRIMKELDRIRK